MKIVVAGGGVAGAASAIALARSGAEVTVYEAHEDPAGTVGSFLSLAVNGLRALEYLGCLPQVQAAGFAVARQRMWAGNGNLLGDVARARRPGDPLHSVTLMRADLVTVLRDEAVRAGARIVTGQRLTGADLRGTRAAGATADDPDAPRGEIASADLVVGADGIWSAARRAVDPAAPEPAYAGLYSVSGVSDGLDWAGPGAWNMIFGRHGAFIYLPAPDGMIWWSAQVSAKAPPEVLAGLGPDELAAVFRREQRAVAILRGARTVHAATLHHVLAPVRRWHGSDIVLIGDAAHPAGAGQGASMAIEDAVELARQLGRPGTVADGLARFDAARRDRAGKMAKTAAANRDAKTAGPVAAAFRNLIMPVMFGRFYERAAGWLYDYDPGITRRPQGEPTGLGASRNGLS
jgi:2-polyprenyl-6-methoxyphenol hydroxylase-like FAD-dependent oxidoreductase